MHHIVRVLLGIAAIASLAACQKDTADIKTTSSGETNVSASADSAKARGHSMVRMVNAVMPGGMVALHLGDSALFESIKPGSVSDYREVDATMAKFSVVADSKAPMTDTRDHVLMDGNRYTVMMVSEDVSKNILRVYQDEVIPDSGMARIRILHAAPSGPELDVSVVGAKDKLFSDIDFKSEAGYKDIPPATVTLQVRAHDKSAVLLTIPKLELKRGTSTTVVVSGAGKLSYFTFTDAMIAPNMH